MSSVPANLLYSEDHEWVNATEVNVGDTVRAGITAVAAERLGDVVFAELPAVGDQLTHSETCGEVESTKSVSDLYAPVSGTVTAVNEAVEDDCSLINSDPYGEGWLFEVEVSEVGPLMTAAEYAESNNLD